MTYRALKQKGDNNSNNYSSCLKKKNKEINYREVEHGQDRDGSGKEMRDGDRKRDRDRDRDRDREGDEDKDGSREKERMRERLLDLRAEVFRRTIQLVFVLLSHTDTNTNSNTDTNTRMNRKTNMNTGNNSGTDNSGINNTDTNQDIGSSRSGSESGSAVIATIAISSGAVDGDESLGSVEGILGQGFYPLVS